MADDTVNVKITGDSKGYQKAAQDAQKSTTNLGKSVANLKVPWLAVGAAVASVGVALKSTIQTAAKFEDIGVSFRVLTGDADKATQSLEQLQQFASGTPFQFDEVASAGKTFLAFGFEVSELTRLLQETGDVAAATGNSLNEIALIYGQVAAAGKLTGERLLQLRERGINVGPAIAESLGTTEKAVADLVSKGKVSFEVFEKAFATLSQEGGIAFGGLELKSQTLNGKLSTLADNWEQLSKSIGGLFLPVAKDATDLLTDLVREANKLFKDDTPQERAGKIVDELMELGEELKSLEGKQSTFDKIFGNEALRAEAIEKTKAKITDLNAELEKLAQAELARQAKANEGSVAEKSKQLENQKKIREEILKIDQDYDQLSAEQRQDRLDQIAEQEEEERNRKLEQKALELEDQGKFEEALFLIGQERRNKEKKALQLQNKIQAQAEKERRAILQSSFSQISTLQSSENRALIAVGKAAGIANVIISTNVGAAKALELGPIIGPPLAAAIIAAGAVNAANIAGVQGFENGGVIGGINGATTGSDNAIATVRNGEMVLNATQQKSLFDFINSGASATLTGQEDENDEITVNVRLIPDEKRLFRAVEQQVIAARATGTSKI